MRPREASPSGWAFLESRIRYHTANAMESTRPSNGLQVTGLEVKLEPLRCYAFYLQIAIDKRADERTRTADLLITSERSGVAVGCTLLRFPHI